MPSGRRREAEHLGQPPHDAAFDVRRRVVAAPAVRVHARGQKVREDADRIRRRVDEAVEAGVRVAHREGHHVLAHEREDLLEGPTLLGQRLVEERTRGFRLFRRRGPVSARRDARRPRRRRALRDGGARRAEGRRWASSCRGLNHGPRKRAARAAHSDSLSAVILSEAKDPGLSSGSLVATLLGMTATRPVAAARSLHDAAPIAPARVARRLRLQIIGFLVEHDRLADDGVRARLDGQHGRGDDEVALAVCADRDVAPVAVVVLRLGRAAVADFRRG